MASNVIPFPAHRVTFSSFALSVQRSGEKMESATPGSIEWDFSNELKHSYQRAIEAWPCAEIVPLRRVAQ